MKCPVCMNEVDGKFEICSNCGARLHQSTENANNYGDNAVQNSEIPPRPPRPVQMPPQQTGQPPQPPFGVPVPQQGQTPVPPQGQMPPQGYVQNGMPVPPPQTEPESSSKKNTKLIVILSIVGIVVVAIVAIIIIAVAGSGSAPSGGDTYITNNYHINIMNDMQSIQDEFMVDGRVPKDKYPALFDKQCEFLDSHMEEYDISYYERNDENIVIYFNEGEDWTYDPEDYYVDIDDDDTETTEKTESNALVEKLCSKEWCDIVNEYEAYGEAGINIKFKKDGTFTSVAYNMVDDLETSGKYTVDGDEVRLTTKQAGGEKITYTIRNYDDDDIVFAETDMSGTKNQVFLYPSDKTVKENSTPDVYDKLDGTVWDAECIKTMFSEQKAENFAVFKTGENDDYFEARINGYHGTYMEVEGCGLGDEIAGFRISTPDSEYENGFLFLICEGSEAHALFYVDGELYADEMWESCN